MAEKISTRSRILDIAEASVLEKGFEATSIEEIVTGAEISRSGFFYHFKDKTALHARFGINIPESDYPQIATPALAVAYLADAR